MFERKHRDRQSSPTKDQQPFFSVKPSPEMPIQKQGEEKARAVSPQPVYRPKRFTPTQLLGNQPPQDRVSAIPLQAKLTLDRAGDRGETLQARSDNSNDREVSPDIERSINRSRGEGQSLDEPTQRSMSQTMGADFSSVKIHTNHTADQLNRALNARAFTTGQDIFFKRGQYNPDNPNKQELLAHELTHTIQQGASPQIRRSPQTSPSLSDFAGKTVQRSLSGNVPNIQLEWEDVDEDEDYYKYYGSQAKWNLLFNNHIQWLCKMGNNNILYGFIIEKSPNGVREIINRNFKDTDNILDNWIDDNDLLNGDSAYHTIEEWEDKLTQLELQLGLGSNIFPHPPEVNMPEQEDNEVEEKLSEETNLEEQLKQEKVEEWEQEEFVKRLKQEQEDTKNTKTTFDGMCNAITTAWLTGLLPNITPGKSGINEDSFSFLKDVKKVLDRFFYILGEINPHYNYSPVEISAYFIRTLEHRKERSGFKTGQELLNFLKTELKDENAFLKFIRNEYKKNHKIIENPKKIKNGFDNNTYEQILDSGEDRIESTNNDKLFKKTLMGIQKAVKSFQDKQTTEFSGILSVQQSAIGGESSVRKFAGHQFAFKIKTIAQNNTEYEIRDQNSGHIQENVKDIQEAITAISQYFLDRYINDPMVVETTSQNEDIHGEDIRLDLTLFKGL